MAKRDYQNGYISVTEALGVLRKIGLEMWYKYGTAKECDEESKRGREIGTEVHGLIEKNINNEELVVDTAYPDEVINAVKSFFLFKKENPKIKFELSEIAGTSERYQYNFTTDCKASLPNEPIIADWKTGNCKKEKKPRIYDESLAQISAYVKGYNEIIGENIKKACVVVFAKDKVAYNIAWLNEQELNEQFNEIFVPALTIAKFQKRKKEEAKKIKQEAKNVHV